MGITLSYRQGQGFNINRLFYGNVIEVNPEKRYVDLTIEVRDYEDSPWSTINPT